MRLTAPRTEAEQRPGPAAAVAPLLGDARYVGSLVNLTDRSIRRMNAAGLMPRPLKVGGSVRWRVAEIKEWVEAGCPDRKAWEARRASGCGREGGRPAS